MTIKHRGIGAFASVFALLSGAAWALFYPAVQITGGPPPTSLCTSTSFDLPVNFNVGSADWLSGTMVVQGAATAINTNLGLPTLNGPGSVRLYPSAYKVPAGTAISVTFKTYDSSGASGGEAYQSTIVFACDTGVVSSLESGAVPIPTMSEWTLAVLALLLSLAGGSVLYRRRTRWP